MHKKSEIEYLIIWKNLNGLASKEEQETLQVWLQASGKNRAYFEKLQANYNDDLILSPEEIKDSWSTIDHRTIKKGRKLQMKRWMQYAAAIIGPVLLAIAIVYISDREEQKLLVDSKITPGETKAVLQLGNGQIVQLDADSKLNIESSKGEVVGTDTLDVLEYTEANPEQKASNLEYNTISVPRGGEYQLVLSDGTKVWLNSETELRYPVYMSGNTREVYLKGEAFFDVSKDKNRAFMVHTNTSVVKVYGTAFNVMSYEKEGMEETTLVEGSVAIVIDGNEQLIKPGEQSQLEKASGNLSIHDVDTELYTAWKDGVFRFEEMTLAELAVKLERWYDVDFFFANEEVREKRFTGAVRRETEFAFFMNLIEESTKVEVEVEDRTILVKALY